MGPTFSIAINDVAIPTNATDTLANIKSVLEIPAPANQGIRVTSVDMTFDGLPNTTNKPVLVQLVNATATGTFPSSSITPIATNNDGAAVSTLLTAANIKYGVATGEGTVASGNGWRLYRLIPTAGQIIQLPLGREIWVPKANFFRIRMVGVNAVNVCINIEVEE